MAGSLTQPVFQGRRLKANFRYAVAQHEEMLLAYQQTIQGAFKDVSNALIGYRSYRKYRLQQEQLVESPNDAARLSQLRFKAGTAAYLEVLTNETNAFSYGLQLVMRRATNSHLSPSSIKPLTAAGSSLIAEVATTDWRIRDSRFSRRSQMNYAKNSDKTDCPLTVQ